MKPYEILGVDFDLVSYTDVLRTIQDCRENEQHQYIILTPPHSLLMCQRDPLLRQATDDAALILPDGVGIILAAKLLGYPNFGRVTGPTLMLKICDWGREEGLRHFFYGGAPGVADALAAKLKSNYPGLDVAGTYCPSFHELTPEEDAEVLQQINTTKPDIVWVGLGSPKQEKWMAQHMGQIEAAAMIGVGAAFDFHSGRAKWAPAWLRKMGIEWAYRLAQEPKRMWRRNVNSFVFLARVLHQRVQDNNSK